MYFKRIFLFSFLATACLTTAFLSGFIAHAHLYPRSEFRILNQAYDILTGHALDEIPATPSLEYGMIRGMLGAYGDPHTTFLEPVQQELQTDSLQGSFGGIGVQLDRDEGGNIVLFPYPDGPAALAGIKEGDRLLTVGPLQVTPGIPMETIQAAIRGPEGERISIAIRRPPDLDRIEFKVKRANISLPSVFWHLDPDEALVGIIKINVIAASTPEEIQKAVLDLQERGAAAFILDLRDNGGGLLSAGVDTARLFLHSGEIIQQQYRGKPVERFRVERPGPLVDLPLVVLVNHGTASAAEIIAGSLQVHNRAQLVGAPTFGKDTIQLVFDLQDGSSIHVTSARWWIPALDPPLAENGLQPDILIQPDASGDDPAISAAIQVLVGPE